MTRPVPVIRARAAVYGVLIELAGRRLLWPVAVLVAIIVIWVTWPLVPLLLAIAVLIGVLGGVIALVFADEG